MCLPSEPLSGPKSERTTLTHERACRGNVAGISSAYATMSDSGSTPKWHIAQSNLSIAPYVVCAAAAGGIAVGFFIPFYPTLITIAVVLGAVAFAIQWLGVRLRAHLGFISTLMTILTWLVARDRLLPRGTNFKLTGAQFFAAWLLTFAVLHIVFRARLTKALNEHKDSSRGAA